MQISGKNVMEQLWKNFFNGSASPYLIWVYVAQLSTSHCRGVADCLQVQSCPNMCFRENTIILGKTSDIPGNLILIPK